MSWSRSARWALPLSIAAVVVFWAWRMLQLVNLDQPPSYDEAVYLSRVVPGAHPVSWTAPRASGIPALLVPAAGPGPSVADERAWMLIAVAVLFAIVLLVWSRRIGWAAVMGGALFAVAWVPATYGPLVMPNVMSALAVALLIGMWHLQRTVAILGAVPVALVAGLVRPIDALMGVAICAVSTVVDRSWRKDAARYVCLALATLAIALPFVLESSTWGGVRARLEQSQKLVPSGWRWNVDEYISLSDGPLQLPDLAPGVADGGLTWTLVVLIGFGVGAVVILGRRVAGHRPGSRLGIVSLGFGAFAAAAPYLFYFGGGTSIAIRMLVPAYLLGSLACAAAVRGAFPARFAAIGGAVGAVLVAVAAPSQFEVGANLTARRVAIESVTDSVVQAVRTLTGGRPCSLVSRWNDSTYGFMANCESRRYFGPEEEQWLLDRRSAGRSVVLISDRRHVGASPFAEWDLTRIQGPQGGFYLYVPPR